MHKNNKTLRWKNLKYFIFALPILVLWFILTIYPNLTVIPLSLFEWSPLSSKKEFVGLYYYKMMFTYNLKDTLNYFSNTVLYVFYLFVIQTVLAMLLTLVLQKNTTHNKFFRALFFLPMILSTTMISLTWRYMYDPNLGVINNILGNLGVEGFPGYNFYAPEWKALLCIVFVHIWANIGYPITLYIGGLQTISESHHESAKLDGANIWQDFWFITFPQLLPTLMRTTMLTLSTGAMASDYVLMLGSRSTGVSFDNWASSIYKGITLDSNYGSVSAQSVLLFIVLSVLCVVQYLATKKVEDSFLG